MKKLLTVVTFGLVFALSACTGSATASPSGETKVYTHAQGETEVAMNPERVVVFDWATMDTMVELGVDAAIVGVPQSNMPGYLGKFATDAYTNVGSAKEADLEAIAALDPELIIISGRQADLYDDLSEIAPTLYVGLDYTDYLNSFEYSVQTIGEIFNAEEEATAIITDIQSDVATLVEKADAFDGNALVALANDGKISAYGNGSRFGMIFEVFGLTNVDETIESSTHGQSIGFEYILEKNPDLLYVVDRSAVVGGDSSAEQLFNNEIVNQTKASQNGTITYLTADYWYAANGGAYSFSKMIEEITASLN